MLYLDGRAFCQLAVALTLFVGRREDQAVRPYKNWVMRCWRGCLSELELGADYLQTARPMPLATAIPKRQNPTVSCLIKIQNCFIFLVPSCLSYPGKEAVKRMFYGFSWAQFQMIRSVARFLCAVGWAFYWPPRAQYNRPPRCWFLRGESWLLVRESSAEVRYTLQSADCERPRPARRWHTSLWPNWTTGAVHIASSAQDQSSRGGLYRP